MIKLVIIDDSSFVRKALIQVFKKHTHIQVVGEASRGSEAIEVVDKIKPDAVLLDLDMPGMSGLEILRKLRGSHAKLPILIFSSMSQKQPDVAIQALSLGATDYLDKSILNLADFGKVMRFFEQYFEVSREGLETDRAKPKLDISWSEKDICLIGASAGGPSAVEKLITSLDPRFPIPVVVAIHMPETFTRLFAERLNALSRVETLEAKNGMKLEKGTIYIAPGEHRIRFASASELSIVKSPSQDIWQPSIDLLFESGAELFSKRAVGIILTGMGSDGTKGMKHLHEKGAVTIAESASSAAIYGMPRSAIQSGAVDHILTLREMIQIFKYPAVRRTPR